MKDALIINPHDVDEMSEALQQALHMPQDERIKRYEALMHSVETYDVYSWQRNFLAALQETAQVAAA